MEDELIVKPKKNETVFNAIIYSTTIVILGFFSLIYQISFSESMKMITLAIIMISILLFFMKMNKIDLYQNSENVFIISAGYLFALFGVMLSFQYEIYNIWMLGIVIIAISVNQYFGIALHFILIYLMFIGSNPRIEYFIFYFILGTILCMLAKFIPQKSTIGYVIAIAVACNLTLWFILNDFDYTNPNAINVVLSIGSTFIVICLAYFIHHSMNKRNLQGKDMTLEEKHIVRNIDEIISEEFVLLQKLQSYSQKLYIHSVNIGELSFEAAKEIGCDEKVAKAGGLYHEIGRIQNKNYIEEGIQIAVEYQLPDKVIDVIRQHNSKFEKPRSMEAAIVMLSDSVISTIDYIKNMQNKKVSYEQLVENIFELRFTKGMLDESGITISNYKLLMNFYKEIDYDNSFRV